MNTKTTKERMEKIIKWVDSDWNEDYNNLSATTKSKLQYTYKFYNSLPSGYRDNYIETIEEHPGNTAAINAVINLDIKNGENLVIYSNNSGNGKTKLSVAGLYHHLLNTPSPNPHLVTNHCTVGLVNLTDYFGEALANFGGAKNVLPNMIYPDLLLIDDTGKSKPSEYVYQEFYRIMEKRWSNKKSTIFTSNYMPNDLAQRIRPEHSTDNALFSRIMSGKVVEVIGKDRRLQNR